MFKEKDNLLALADIERQITQLEARKKMIHEEMLMDIGDDGYEYEGYKAIKVTRRTFKLKEGVTTEYVKERFPEAVETKTTESVNMDYMKAVPSAHELLQASESSFIKFTEPKK